MTAKDLLFINMRKACEALHQDVFDYLPLTYVIDFSTSHFNQFDEFVQVFSTIERIKKKELDEINAALNKNLLEGHKRVFAKRQLTESMYASENLWLLKPASCNRGRGVHVFGSLTEL